MARTPHRNPGRKRRLGGWVLLTMAVMIAGVWAASGWWRFGCSTRRYPWGCSSGYVWMWTGATKPSDAIGWFFSPQPEGYELMWRIDRPAEWNDTYLGMVHVSTTETLSGSYYLIQIILWPLPSLLAVLGIPLLLSGLLARRRARVGHCPRCGYDRRGLPVGPGAVCPECGQ